MRAHYRRTLAFSHLRPRALLSVVLIGMAFSAAACASESQPGNAAQRAREVLSERPALAEPDSSNVTQATGTGSAKLNLLELVWTARWLMAPILVMSLLVVAIGIERSVALRRQSVLPIQLKEYVGQLTHSSGPIDASHLGRRCLQYPSPTATIMQTVVRHRARPYAELEKEVSETSQREAEQLYRNVRTLNLAAAVTPLIGLLGTVWGMIEAFFATANLPVGVNKAESLAQGIYTALVTTAGGLLVAIPAAILAHMFEGRIQRLFHDVHGVVHDQLLPLASRIQRVRPPVAKPPRAKASARAK